MNPTHLGLVAGFLTTSAIIPQIVKAYRSKMVRDISIWQPVLLSVGLVLWLIYGLMLNDTPLILANAVSLFCNMILITLKLIYGRRDRQFA
ncbi:MAG TPA: SemiSWEET transporter [Geobacterales bacterium]|nr:SemiSWEET transporter [Geobacterales bacterium]